MWRWRRDRSLVRGLRTSFQRTEAVRRYPQAPWPPAARSSSRSTARSCTADDPIGHLDDPMFARGDGVFETVLLRDARACLLDAHLERLARSAAIVGLPRPDPERWRAATLVAAAQRGGHGDAVLRMVFGRAAGRRPDGIRRRLGTARPGAGVETRRSICDDVGRRRHDAGSGHRAATRGRPPGRSRCHTESMPRHFVTPIASASMTWSWSAPKASSWRDPGRAWSSPMATAYWPPRRRRCRSSPAPP